MAYPSRTDIVTAMKNPHVSFKVPELQGGSVIQKNNRIIQYSGGYTSVFPFKDKHAKKVALRCWIADIGEAKKRSQTLATYLSNLNKSYFAGFRYIDDALLVNGALQPIVLMDWVNGQTLKHFIGNNLHQPDKIRNVAVLFKEMVAYFHEQSIAHGDLQHGNLIVTDDGKLVVVDYDSMYVEPLSGFSDNIKGLPGYQHPARRSNQYLHAKLDYFSELVIYLGLQVFADNPGLWNLFYDTEDLLFSRDDLEKPDQSQMVTSLCHSRNPLIADLSCKLKEELQVQDIQHLRPLEELLVNKLEVAKSNIIDKWEQQPNKPQPTITKLPGKDSIINKF
jgi:serine/threonine protein kinase